MMFPFVNELLSIDTLICQSTFISYIDTLKLVMLLFFVSLLLSDFLLVKLCTYENDQLPLLLLFLTYFYIYLNTHSRLVSLYCDDITNQGVA